MRKMRFPLSFFVLTIVFCWLTGCASSGSVKSAVIDRSRPIAEKENGPNGSAETEREESASEKWNAESLAYFTAGL